MVIVTAKFGGKQSHENGLCKFVSNLLNMTAAENVTTSMCTRSSEVAIRHVEILTKLYPDDDILNTSKVDTNEKIMSDVRHPIV